MKRIFAFLLVMVLCLSCASTSFAIFSRADYDSPAGKEGYSPSKIYHKSAGGYSAVYHLESYMTDSAYCSETIKVHMWNRQLAEQVTSRLSVSVGNDVTLNYLKKPTSSQTLKPVTYKTNTDHYGKLVTLKAEFEP